MKQIIQLSKIKSICQFVAGAWLSADSGLIILDGLGDAFEPTVNPTFVPEALGLHSLLPSLWLSLSLFHLPHTPVSTLGTVPSSLFKFLKIWIRSGAVLRWKRPFWKRKKKRQYPVGWFKYVLTPMLTQSRVIHLAWGKMNDLRTTS